MAKPNPPQKDQRLSGALRNSLSKFTGRVTVKDEKEEAPTAPRPAAPAPRPPAAAPRQATPEAPHRPTATPPSSPPSQSSRPASPSKTPPAKPAPASPPSNTNRIGNDVTIEGQLRFRDQLNVNGRIKGEIESEGTLVIEGDAVIDANIRAASVMVQGTVTGNITARDEIRLGSTAKVVGNLTTATLQMEAGAVFSGQSKVGKSS
ncbi:MAG: polymer-forming cytoskeletal protein [Verrucomicrobiota bacterium JB023]|nr:polymer-forming cytoskeletal protein [Verrucomicrobiota bacterium JB023]